MTIVEFLEQRITEEESVAHRAAVNELYTSDGAEDWSAWAVKGMMRVGMGVDSFEHVTHWSPARVLAECAAKRGIIKACEPNPNASRDAYAIGKSDVAHRVMRALASPYADHPDYQQEWRP